MTRKAKKLFSEEKGISNGCALILKTKLLKIVCGDGASCPTMRAFCKRFNDAIRKADSFPNISNGTSVAIRYDLTCQSSPFPPILLIDILHDLFAPLMFKVNINVRWLIPLFADEASKKEIDFDRINRGDPETVTDGRVCGCSTTLAENATGASKPNNIVAGKEVVLVFKLMNEGKLVIDETLHP
jgi:hypothetical protein